MVHFPSAAGGSSPDDNGRLAKVSYLPGAGPGARQQPDLESGHERESATARENEPSTKATSRASNVSMHQLARRGMSRWELGQVLEKRGVDDSLAAAELDRLESVGLLDDAALAVTLVFTQHTRRGLGRAAIAQELKRRHIDAETIEEALAEIADDDELVRATELALKRVPQLHAVDDETAKRRLNGFLARKGYGSSVVRAAIQTAMETRKSGVRFR